MAPVLEQSLPTFMAFGKRHGYDVVVGSGREAADRAPAWAKVRLIRRLLDSYEFVLWIDADAIILDDSDDPADVLASGAFQAVVKHQWDGQEQPCTGVWLLRSGEEARRFLDALWDDGRYLNEHPWEQAVAMLLLGYRSVAPGIMGSPTHWMAGTQWLADEWDHIPILSPGRRLGQVRIRHYAACPNPVRRSQMRNDRREIEARSATGLARVWYRTSSSLGRARWRLVYAPERHIRLRKALRRIAGG